ncbi:hypothetical protein RJ641_035259 [Dillenia turbinata]|uniref:Uncharacterized protein n=1 Tax=Dillenia turbinata TaxID=194707 RepID=A0AAN8VNQ8_9MAGN
MCWMVVKSEDGRELRSFNFKDEDQSQEVRAIERRISLETLANQLPPDVLSCPESLQMQSRISLCPCTSIRWPHIFPLKIGANLVGSLLQWENPVVCSVRNNVIIPKPVRPGPKLEHTNFECEPL